MFTYGVAMIALQLLFIFASVMAKEANPGGRLAGVVIYGAMLGYTVMSMTALK